MGSAAPSRSDKRAALERELRSVRLKFLQLRPSRRSRRRSELEIRRTTSMCTSSCGSSAATISKLVPQPDVLTLQRECLLRICAWGGIHPGVKVRIA